MFMKIDPSGPNKPMISLIEHTMVDECALENSVSQNSASLKVVVEILGSNPISVRFPELEKNGVMVEVLIDYFNGHIQIFTIPEQQVREGETVDLQPPTIIVDSVAELKEYLRSQNLPEGLAE